MSLFVCSKCQSIENTALSGYHWREDKEKPLCSGCDPQFKKGWHGRFSQEKFDPKKWEYYDGNFIREKVKK